jgi:nondiscriminating glutamyl-tRNA synthetase
MPQSPVITRFAPSPTGELHLGNARTALFNALLARHHGGQFLLRVEDTDAARSRPEHAELLQADLQWLGVAWSGPVLFQSQRADVYDRLLGKLEQQGQAYPCFCTTRELELARAAQLSAGRPPRYAGTCRKLNAGDRAAKLAAGVPATLRFAVPEGEAVSFTDLVHGPRLFAAGEIGDFVLRRADGSAAFFFSNAVDDALSGVTHVLRGDDHLSNTPRQLLIQQALQLQAPHYGHLALLTGPDGSPLSKRHGAASLRALRELGLLPVAVNNQLFRLGHSSSEHGLLSLDDMAKAFDVTHLQRSPAHFEMSQLLVWQKEAVHKQSLAEATAWLGARLPASVPVLRRDLFLQAVLPNLVHPDDALPWIEVVFGADPAPDTESLVAIQGAAPALFTAAAAAASDNDFAAIAAAAKAASGAKGPALFKPLRGALTGKLAGPELAPLLRAFDPGVAQRRLARFA